LINFGRRFGIIASVTLSAIEQISYLLFIKRLDDLELLKERKAQRLGQVIENPVFSGEQQRIRWSYFKNLTDAEEMLRIVREKLFPLLKTSAALYFLLQEISHYMIHLGRSMIETVG
jgi:HsdM N-terminal domain